MSDFSWTDPLAQLTTRPLVQKWTVSALLKIVDQSAGEGRAERGKRVFRTALCLNCHRVNGQGGMIGPDLTHVTRRFNSRDLVEAIVDPNKVISEQYRSVQILTQQGRIIDGKITDVNKNTLLLMNDALNPADLTTVNRDDIDEMDWSNTSMMSSGLLDTFSTEEIVDLFAFLRAAATR